MPIQDLKDQIARLPEQPGVYLYANAAGGDHLRRQGALAARPRAQLPGRPRHEPPTDALLDEAAGLEVIVTDSVVEALALENHLIKQRNPRYNILLRDDKNYPYLQLTTGEAFPRVLVARRVERDGDVYAGPFLPASLARRTMGADAPAVRHPLVQRGDHGSAAGRASSTTSSAASRRASPRSARPSSTRGRGRHAAVPRGAQRRAADTLRDA
jgi:hypothetical protein